MNKKEEVLDIKLTQYGKKLLSIGELDPIYYTFHDEGVIYDSEYASFQEIQNDIEGRILEDTPSLRTQHNFTSAKESGGTIKITNPDGSTDEIDVYQISSRAALGSALGQSEYNNQNYPAFKMSIFGGEITSVDTGSANQYGEKIPQINCTVESLAYVRNIDDVQKYPNPFEDVSSPIAADGSYLAVRAPKFLLELLEKNTDFNSSNFDIEAYKETPKGKLIPLSYSIPEASQKIVNGILLGDEEEIDLDNARFSSKDEVEFYFDIIKDENIPSDIISAAKSHFKSDGFFNDKAVSKTSEKTKLSISDIYSTTTNPEDIEECK